VKVLDPLLFALPAGFGAYLIWMASRGTVGMREKGVGEHAIGLASIAGFGGLLIGVTVVAYFVSH
jgi:hypothetical protein